MWRPAIYHSYCDSDLSNLCSMEARLLYIRENEVNTSLANTLNAVERTDLRFLVLVELNAIHDDSMPMINGLREIRISKVKDKITEWFRTKIKSDIKIELSVFEGKPSKENPPVLLNGLNKLNVYVDFTNDIRIVPFLKAQMKPQQITFYPIHYLVNDNSDYSLQSK